MNKAFGIINFAGNHIKVEGLQEYRPVGAFSFLGRYRIIDFPISNMSNSGIDNIQVYVRRKPRSLTRKRYSSEVSTALISLLTSRTWTASRECISRML